MEKIHIHIETLKNKGQVMTVNLTTDIVGMEKISSAALLPEDSILGKEVNDMVEELKRLKREEMKKNKDIRIEKAKKKINLTKSKKA